jgi:hypothetical protein
MPVLPTFPACNPFAVAMEATIFTGWIYDHLLPHAEKVKVAHPLMLRAIAAGKRKNDKIDASKPLVAVSEDATLWTVKTGRLRQNPISSSQCRSAK